jgi:TetR/AcrR family transcriptional regulator, transcriptional repressor for nem operon
MVARAATDLRRQDVRDRLLDAGVSALLSAGYAQTSVDDIVKRAGVPKGSFYYYFASKEALASDAVARYAEMDEPLREALGNGNGKPLVRLKRYFDTYVAHYETKAFVSGCLFGNLALELSDLSPPVRQALSQAMRDWALAIETVLIEAQETGDLSAKVECRTMAGFVVNAWEGALLRMRVEKSAAPLQNFLTITFDQLLVS